jgi:tetratricopeptide (TPR) repeat protein
MGFTRMCFHAIILGGGFSVPAGSAGMGERRDLMGFFDKFKGDRTASWHNEAGLKLAEAGRVAEAIKEFNLGLESAPDDATLRFNLGLAYADADEPEKALDEFRYVVRVAPKHHDAYFALASSYSLLGPELQACVSYRAYLDCEQQGRKSGVARTRLASMAGLTASDAWRQWLEDRRAKQVAFILSVATAGRQLAEVINPIGEKTDGAARQSAIEQCTVQMVSVKMNQITERAAAHMHAGDSLFKSHKYWAAAAQLMEALSELPSAYPVMLMLASCCALTEDFQAAGRVLGMVDGESLDADGRAEMGKMVRELQRHGVDF